MEYAITVLRMDPGGRAFAMTAVAGVPTSGVAAVAVNLGGKSLAGSGGNLRVWPSGEAMPDTWNIQLSASAFTNGFAIVKVGVDGKINVPVFTSPGLRGSNVVPLGPPNDSYPNPRHPPVCGGFVFSDLDRPPGRPPVRSTTCGTVSSVIVLSRSFTVRGRQRGLRRCRRVGCSRSR